MYNDDNITFNKSFSVLTLAPAGSSLTDVNTVSAGYELLLSAGFVVGSPYTTVGLTTGTDINIISVDRPTLNVNSKEYTAVVNFMGVDAGDTQHLYNLYFDTRDYKRLGIKRLDMFTPNANVFNLNLNHYGDRPNGISPLSATIESEELTRGMQDSKIFTMEGFKSSMVLSVDSLEARSPMVFSYGTAVSGRLSNPAGYKDFTTGTIRMCAGLSATTAPGGDSESTGGEVAGTSIQPYSHTTSVLLLNTPLSGLEKEVVVTWDMALWTNTTENSAYAQVAS